MLKQSKCSAGSRSVRRSCAGDCYSPCIAHGYDLLHSLDQQKGAVNSGYWPLMRFDPNRRRAGLNPLQLDSKPPFFTA